MPAQKTSATRKRAYNEIESQSLLQKHHESPSNAIRITANIHQVLFNPHLLANIMQFVSKKLPCLLVNKVWNKIVGPDLYKEKLKWIDTGYERGLIMDEIGQSFQQSLLNKDFTSGLAHILKRKDTTICFQREYRGGFPICSITRLNALLNPSITDFEVAGASLVLAMEATETATFQVAS